MFDSFRARIQAEMRPEFLAAAWPIMAPVTFPDRSGLQRAKPKPVFGEWYLAYKLKCHKHFGYSGIWTATHAKLGVVVAFAHDRLISVSCSLPRILFGDNARELRSQEDVESALSMVRDVVATVAHVEDCWHHARLDRLDLVRYAALPLQTIKQALAHARHPCSREEPVVRSNSLFFDGTSVGIFFYDKEKKDRAAKSGFRTRIEVRLQSRDAIHKAGLSLALPPDVFEAQRVFDEILGQFPGQGAVTSVPRQSIYAFLAWTESAVVAEVAPRPLAVYGAMCCPSPASLSKVRREVARVTPQLLQVRLSDTYGKFFLRGVEPVDLTPRSCRLMTVEQMGELLLLGRP